MADLLPGEEVPEKQKVNEVDRARTITSDVFSFVRSQEINRTIASFTLDHYIDEAKRQIKGEGRQLRNAAGEAVDVRPSKLEALEKLETEFYASMPLLEGLAKKAETAEEDAEEES